MPPTQEAGAPPTSEAPLAPGAHTPGAMDAVHQAIAAATPEAAPTISVPVTTPEGGGFLGAQDALQAGPVPAPTAYGSKVADEAATAPELPVAPAPLVAPGPTTPDGTVPPAPMSPASAQAVSPAAPEVGATATVTTLGQGDTLVVGGSQPEVRTAVGTTAEIFPATSMGQAEMQKLKEIVENFPEALTEEGMENLGSQLAVISQRLLVEAAIKRSARNN